MFHAAAAAAVMLMAARALVAAEPVISEFLVSNKNTNEDEDGDSSDWVEIYNPNSTPIDLGGYCLTDDTGKLAKWKFPNVTLGGHGYFLVWASGKDRTDPAKPLHANFKLSDEDDYLAIVKPDGASIASDYGPEFPDQSTDVSYGMRPGGGPAALLSPTPGGPNKVASLVADVQFDHDRGLHWVPFDLKLSTPTDGASIRYTTDGSAPTPNTGTLYVGPIPIDNTTVVRAVGYKDGSISTKPLAGSYIFPARVLQQPELVPGYPNPPQPVNNPGRNQVNVPLTYGMDPEIVNDPQYAQQALEGLSQIPTLSVGVNPGNIFGPNGFYDTPRGPDETKHPISFEFIDPNRPKNNVGVNAGISGHSKQKLKRSFHVHFGTKYGGSPRLKARIFESAPLGGGSATDEFTNLILRAGNNRSWATTGWPSKTTYTEDEYVRSTQIAMTGHGVHGTFVHLYINGIYWGLYNMVERPNAGFGGAYFGSRKGNYFSFSQKGVESGDDARWNYMIDTLCRKDMAVSANYQEMQEYLDVRQFASYLIGQWYCGVSDWPDTNYWAGGDTAKKQPFRFFVWDAEEMMNTVNRFPSAPHGPWVNPAFAKNPVKRTGPIVKLWAALKRNPEFMAMFADEVRRNVTNDGPLTDANALARWNTLNASIDKAIVCESARWGDALVPVGRPTYAKNNAWIIATREIANDLKGAGAKFIAALRAEGYYP